MENKYKFTVTLLGEGETPEEAWGDAIEAFGQDPGEPHETRKLTVLTLDEMTEITDRCEDNDILVKFLYLRNYVHFKFIPQPRGGWCYTEFEKIIHDATNDRLLLHFDSIYDQFDDSRNEHEINIRIGLEEK